MAVLTFRYEFCDLLTDRLITSLEVGDVSFDGRIIQPGTYKGSTPIPNRDIAGQVGLVHAGRSIVHVYQGMDLWGSYIIWNKDISADSKGFLKCDWQGASLESAFDRRKIQEDLAYSQDEQLDILRDLIDSFQGPLNDDMSIVPDATVSGQLRDRIYLLAEDASYGKRMSELANVENGFEYRIRTFVDGGTRVRRLVIGYPKIITSANPHVFTLPGNVESYKESEDAVRGGTRFRTRGDSVTDPDTQLSTPLQSDPYLAQDFLDDGWPIWDITEDRSGVIEKPTLNEYAAELRTKFAGAVTIFQAAVRLDDTTQLSPNTVGDFAKFTIHDLNHPLNDDGVPEFVKTWRVVGMEVTPQQRGTGQTIANLIFEGSDD